MNLKAIVFDKDGVLVDFDRTWTAVLVEMARALSRDESHWHKLLDLAGYDFASGRFLAGSIWAAGNNADLMDIWQPELSGWSRQRLARFIVEKCSACDPVAQVDGERLKQLFAQFNAQGLVLGIATNDAEASANKTMETFGLQPYLSMVMGYDSVTNPKPSPEPVVLFCERHGLTASQVVVVGDNVHDMDMAAAAGAGLKIGVLSGNSNRKELGPHADHLIEDVLELPELFESLR